MRILCLLALSVLCACSPEVVVGDDTAETDEPVDTGPEDTSWVPSGFNVYAVFAVSDEGNLAGWSLSSGETGVPYVELFMWESSDDAPDPENPRTCSVYLILDDPSSTALEDWTFSDESNADTTGAETMNHVGFIVPDTARVETDDCPDWDDSVGTPGDLITAAPWGVGVGNLRTDVAEAITADYTDTALGDLHGDGQLLGASWYSTVWEPNRWASHTAWGAPMSDGVLDVDSEGVPTSYLTVEQVQGAVGLPEGYYQVVSIGGWSADAYLF